jgi:hypothetical protein
MSEFKNNFFNESIKNIEKKVKSYFCQKFERIEKPHFLVWFKMEGLINLNELVSF